jgi:hypothetical protein
MVLVHHFLNLLRCHWPANGGVVFVRVIKLAVLGFSSAKMVTILMSVLLYLVGVVSSGRLHQRM